MGKDGNVRLACFTSEAEDRAYGALRLPKTTKAFAVYKKNPLLAATVLLIFLLPLNDA